jgi:hypothetical protein
LLNGGTEIGSASAKAGKNDKDRSSGKRHAMKMTTASPLRHPV